MNHSTLIFGLILLFAVFDARGQDDSELTDDSKRRRVIRQTMTIEATPPDKQLCQAQIEFTYLQKNTVAEVDSTLTTSDCDASRGNYTVLVRYRDENNELHSIEYPETWQLDDSRKLHSTHEYFIGENVDLVSVRSRRLECLCAAAGEDDEPQKE